jgi:hypothetical protein
MLDMDADVLDWLQENPLWQREIHDLLRAYMEINLIRKTAFEEAAADQQQGVFNMDGQQTRFDYSPPNPQNISAQPFFNFPGAAQQPSAISRALALGKKLTFGGLALGGILYFGDTILPEHLKPSNLLGDFHGRVETAEIKQKQETTIQYEREKADAQAAAQAKWQMEVEAFRQQQQVTAQSLETMATAAQIADAACLGSPLVALFMGNTRDARDLQNTLKAACPEAARIRAEMTRIQAKAAQEGSALMQRRPPGAQDPLLTPAAPPVRR